MYMYEDTGPTSAVCARAHMQCCSSKNHQLFLLHVTSIEIKSCFHSHTKIKNKSDALSACATQSSLGD